MWNGQPQTMTLPDGQPKGAALVIEERGYNTRGMKLDEMRAILADHDDFKNEKCRVDRFLSNAVHTCIFIPKVHCELNPIEQVWSQSKCYTRAYCDYTIQHPLPSKNHSPGAGECFKGEHCELHTLLQKQHVCISGRISCWATTR